MINYIIQMHLGWKGMELWGKNVKMIIVRMIKINKGIIIRIRIMIFVIIIIVNNYKY